MNEEEYDTESYKELENKILVKIQDKNICDIIKGMIEYNEYLEMFIPKVESRKKSIRIRICTHILWIISYL